jgi:hypothetical protein
MLPTKTTNITGLRTWLRGFNFLSESIIARFKMGRSNNGLAL